MSNNADFPPNSGAMLNIAKIIKTVTTYAAEAEIGFMFTNARKKVPSQKNTAGNGSQAAVHAYANRQLSSTCCHNKQNSTKAYQSNGHEFPLVTGKGGAMEIQVILETRNQNLYGLLDKASSGGTSKINVT